MELYDEPNDQLQPCYKCGKSSWIYIYKKENQNMVQLFCCNNHYVEFLKQFLDGKSLPEFDLFPKEMNILELPIHAAQLEFGPNIPKKYLLNMYLDKIEEKIKKIEQDIESFQKMEDPSNNDFIILLINDKSEKEVLKYLLLIQLKILNPNS
jgi:hypothetical protein